MASLVESLRHCNNSQKTSFKYLWELINPTTVQDNWGSVSGPWLSAETIPRWGIPFQKLWTSRDILQQNQQIYNTVSSLPTGCKDWTSWLTDLPTGTRKISSLLIEGHVERLADCSYWSFILHNNWV